MTKKILIIIIPLTVLMLALITGVIPVSATNVACGATLMGDTTMDENLSCGTGDGFIIGASDVTLDMNGFTLEGDTTATNIGVKNIAGHKGLKIVDGTISGFSQGVLATDASNLNIEGVTFRGDTGGSDAHKIAIGGGDNLLIKDVTITMGAGSPWFGEAMRLDGVDGVLVTNVLVHGGFIGVNFACPSTAGVCDPADAPPTNGVVQDSTFIHNFNGVLIANSDDATVKNNVIMDGDFLPGCPFCSFPGVFTKGVNIDFESNSGTKILENEIFNMGNGIRAQVGTHSNLEILKNYIHDNTSDGMFLEDVNDSKINDNNLENNGGDGIRLEDSDDNEIKANTSLGHTDDMTQDSDSDGNLWEGNNCASEDDAGTGPIDCV